MSNNKSLTKNSVFYLLYNILNVAFPLFTGIYVSHILFPYDIGQVEAARNLAQYFVILAFLGIPTYGLREIAKARKDKNELSKTYSELMVINMISTAIFLLLYCVLILSIESLRNSVLLYAIAGISIALNFLNNSWLYEGLEEFKFISLRNFAFKIISFTFLVLLVRSPNDYIVYAFVTIMGTAGNYIINILKAKKFVNFTFINLNLKKHLKPIAFLFTVNLAIEIYSLVDVTMLNIFSTKESVAFYSYGMKIFKIFLQIINTFTMVLVPRLAIYFKEKKTKDFNVLLSRALKIIFILSVPLIIGIWFVGDYVICEIYGSSYLSSSLVLKILSFIFLIAPIGYLLGSRILLISGSERKMIIPVACGALINLILNYFLIQFYQEIGAALASLISEFAVMCIYVFLGHRHYRIIGLQKTLLCVFASCIFMIFFLLITDMLSIERSIITLIQIIGSVIIYFLFLITFREDVTYSYFIHIINKLFNRNYVRNF